MALFALSATYSSHDDDTPDSTSTSTTNMQLERCNYDVQQDNLTNNNNTGAYLSQKLSSLHLGGDKTRQWSGTSKDESNKENIQQTGNSQDQVTETNKFGSDEKQFNNPYQLAHLIQECGIDELGSFLRLSNDDTPSSSSSKDSHTGDNSKLDNTKYRHLKELIKRIVRLNGEDRITSKRRNSSMGIEKPGRLKTIPSQPHYSQPPQLNCIQPSLLPPLRYSQQRCSRPGRYAPYRKVNSKKRLFVH